MDAATLRKVVWEEMLFANMRANYFAELLRSYQKQDKWLRVAVLVASSGAVGTTLFQLDAPVKLAAPILAAAGSFWLLISQKLPAAARIGAASFTGASNWNRVVPTAPE